MSNSENFSKRITLLRNSYDLSTSEMAALLGMKSYTSVVMWGDIKNHYRPEYDMLLKIALLFGISIDWLTGLSNIPITEDSIKAANIEFAKRRLIVDLECKLFNALMLEIEKQGIVPQIPPSLEWESNVIFLYNATYLHDLEQEQRQRAIDWSIGLLTGEEPAGRLKRLEKKQRNRYQILVNILMGRLKEPPFKIPKEYTI